LRKGTIFKYEIKRLLLSKEYLLLLVATILYGTSLLRSMVIFGTNYTAPFSHLTFGTYCASLAPFLFILLLVLCARQMKSSERGAETIISATPMPMPVFRLLRYDAIACAFLLAAALPVTACFVCYRLVFNYTAFGELLLSSLFQLIPSAVFLFGIAIFMGKWSAAAVYVLLAVVLIVSVFQIPLPGFIDIMGSSSDFELTPAFITVRTVLTGIGIVFILASLFTSRKQLK